MFFFFKQKTAYEMRISDWSSDVCSSDLFRFDLPGVGEAPRILGCDHQQATRSALDHLSTRLGCNRFVVGGICSAADLGWRIANDDQRVVGLLMFDGITFTGPWFYVGRVASLLRRSPRQWLGAATRLQIGRAPV